MFGTYSMWPCGGEAIFIISKTKKVFKIKIRELLIKLPKIFKKSPHVIAKRIFIEIKVFFSRKKNINIKNKFRLINLLKKTRSNTLGNLWVKMSSMPHCVSITEDKIALIEKLYEGDSFFEKKIFDGMNNTVDLLGTGPINLGDSIDWIKDYKTEIVWPNQYAKDIEYSNLDQDSDVKIPWEISRMNWLLPIAQKYILTKEDKYAEKIKETIQSWIDSNPYAHSVNWCCTMEVAMRIIIWSFLFHACKDSSSWKDNCFREQFLIALFLHVHYTSNNLEYSDINGNHYTANAAGLVFGGLLFSFCRQGERWHKKGWEILTQEIILQVEPDGPNFEGSIPYHRLVTELFLLPAMQREWFGLKTPEYYKKQLVKMGEFIASYSRKDGSVPLLGDGDDARVLPMDTRYLNDHRYLIGMIGLQWSEKALIAEFSGPMQELAWFFPPKAIDWLKDNHRIKNASKAFPKAGYYVMKNEHDHVFIDCAPVGQKGRGGHGHNDCLSFELFLDDNLLIVDSGSFVYTASYKYRNQFRSVHSHNTPIIDGKEINRFVDEKNLWSLHNDAKPLIFSWHDTKEEALFEGGHLGYHRKNMHVSIKRKIRLNHMEHSFHLEDTIGLDKKRSVSIPFHLHPDVDVKLDKPNQCILQAQDKCYLCVFKLPDSWDIAILDSEYSPSYGKKKYSKKIVCLGEGISSLRIGMDIKQQLEK